MSKTTKETAKKPEPEAQWLKNMLGEMDRLYEDAKRKVKAITDPCRFTWHEPSLMDEGKTETLDQEPEDLEEGDSETEEHVEVGLAQHLTELHKNDTAFNNVAPIEQPYDLTKPLADYQLQGVAECLARAQANRGVIITDDIGQGKTIQSLVLALMLLHACPRRRDELGILIVVPADAIAVWKMHLDDFYKKHSAPSYIIIHADWNPNFEVGIPLKEMCKFEIVICTISALKKEREIGSIFRADPFQPVPRTQFFDSRWKVLIIDEIRCIRSLNSASHKSARMIVADYRIGLTGTAIRNRIGDWHSLFCFLQFKPWNNPVHFRKAYTSEHVRGTASGEVLGEPARQHLRDWDVAVNQVAFSFDQLASSTTSNDSNESNNPTSSILDDGGQSGGPIVSLDHLNTAEESIKPTKNTAGDKDQSNQSSKGPENLPKKRSHVRPPWVERNDDGDIIDLRDCKRPRLR